MSEYILEVDNLVRHFGLVRAVDGVSFKLRRGQSVGLIGANGAGKTTALRMITGLDMPDNGSIIYDGTDMICNPDPVRGKIGWMPDSFAPDKSLTVRDFVDFFARAYGLTGDERVQEVSRVLDFCGVADLQDRMLAKLSKGQTQRVSLARMLIGNPDFLLMDEPAAGLDPKARAEFKQLVRSLQAQGKTLLISSHILSELAEMCDTMIFMDAGKILRVGSRDELTQERSRSVYRFVCREGGEALAVALTESPDWTNVLPPQDGAVLAEAVAEDDAEIAQALRRLSQQVLLVEMTPVRRNLEETFIDLLNTKP